MGCFRRKIPSDLCHIVAKIAFWGVSTKRLRADVSENQDFLIFAYLRATDFALENIRFSVLKSEALGHEKSGRPVWGGRFETGVLAVGWRQRLRARSNSWSASLMQRYHWPSTFTGLNMKPMVLGAVSAESVFSKKRMLYFTSFCPCELNE